MVKIDVGDVGAVVGPVVGEGRGFVDAAVALEAMGYATIWLTGGPLASLDQIAQVVEATERVTVATGILSVDRFPADDVAALYHRLEGSHPGRFVVGLGGAHGARPLPTLAAYLDRLDEAGVPAGRRVMAALGPRMLDLARDRAAGVLPVLVTPEYTADARARLGDDTTLAIEQLLVLESDADRARALARQPLGFLASAPGYQRSFRRMGIADEDVAGLRDGLVDAVVPWGDTDTVVAHLRRHLDAGADHLAISPVTGSDAQPLDEWRRLADALELGL
jgi:probable F420-dependent oxidoreductase